MHTRANDKLAFIFGLEIAAFREADKEMEKKAMPVKPMAKPRITDLMMRFAWLIFISFRYFFNSSMPSSVNKKAFPQSTQAQ